LNNIENHRFSIYKEKSMLSKFSDLLHAWAKGWLVLSVFAALVIFMAITLPLLSLIYPAGNEMVSLDDPVFYTPEEIFSIVESWGDGGRTYQLWLHLTWDFIVPVLGLLFVGLFVSWLLQRSFRPESKLQRLNLVALGSVFDLLENICLISMIVVYPARPVIAGWLKTIFTMSKYGFAIPIILIILIGLIKAVANRFEVQEAVTVKV
jgi:hypothetical protein